MFRFLPARDLKTVRLVSKLWWTLVRPVFRRKAVVTLTDYVAIYEFLEAFATTPTSRLPFQNYKICHLDFNADVEDEKDAFWEMFGASILSLELFYVRMVGVEIVRDILFRNCPNLKTGIVFFMRQKMLE